MLKIGWIQKAKHREVLNMIQGERNLVSSIHQRKHNWIGHVLRYDGLLNRIIEGKIEGKRGGHVQDNRWRFSNIQLRNEMFYTTLQTHTNVETCICCLHITHNLIEQLVAYIEGLLQVSSL